jgi:hypothetical protein
MFMYRYVPPGTLNKKFSSLFIVILDYYYFSAIEFSPGGSSPYTSTDKTNQNKYIYINETVKKTQ